MQDAIWWKMNVNGRQSTMGHYFLWKTIFDGTLYFWLNNSKNKPRCYISLCMHANGRLELSYWTIFFINLSLTRKTNSRAVLSLIVIESLYDGLFLVLNCGDSAAANRSAQAKMSGVHPGQTVQGSAGTLHPPPLHQAQPHPPHLQAATQTTPAPPQHHPAKAVVCQGDLECVWDWLLLSYRPGPGPAAPAREGDTAGTGGGNNR